MALKADIKRALCAALIFLLCWSAVLPAAAAVIYPGGVTREMAAAAVGRADALVKDGVPALTGKSLRETVDTALCSDETLSSLLLGVYTSVSDQGDALRALGIDTSPAAVARGLSGYPNVKSALLSAADWNAVDAAALHWGVTKRAGVANAVSAMLTPFNDLLYMLLCGGTYRVGILTLRGEDGYENGLIPILQALGCKSIPAKSAFVAAATADRSAMVRKIAESVFSMIDAMLPQPVTFLCDQLPVLAAFIRDGGLENAVDALMRPITLHIGSMMNLFTGSQMVSALLFLQNPRQYTANFADNVTTAMNDLLASSDLTLADIDLDRLKSCRGSRADAFMDILRWLVETLRLNTETLSERLAGQTNGMDLSPLLAGLKRHSTDEIMLVFIGFLTADEGTALDAVWPSQPFERGEAVFTAHLGRKQFKRVLDGIDATLNDFAVEFGGAKSLRGAIRAAVYDSATVTTLAKTLYGAFAGEEMQAAAALLGLPATPGALAAALPSRYGAAKQTLSRAKTWDAVTAIRWGFAGGDRGGFEAALTAALSPMRPLLEAFLANGAAPVLGGLRIGGTNGYNTAVIPLLEALSCPAGSIKSYNEYLKGKGTDRIITDVLTPVLDLLDRLAEKPVATLTQLLPNAVFFLQNGGLRQCVQNLLYPLTQLMGSLGLTQDALGLDLGAIAALDPDALLADALDTAAAATGLKLEQPDLSGIAALGRKVQVQSKRTLHGEPVTVDYIKPDRPAVLVTLLRYVVTVIKDPANEAAVAEFMAADAQSGNEMFATYSSGITEEFAAMTVDETIEWLYKLLFRERVTRTEPDDDYVPHIRYVPEKDNTVPRVIAGIAAGAVLAAAVVLFLKRDAIRAHRRRKNRQTAMGAEDTQQEG
ncbi:MAG: hypothetical protein IKN72_11135 [Clostridia bacterium]|nr:hypothetical protein [Clostridia bacterium]